MSFEKYLTEQIGLHPSMQYQDMVKLCYQAAYGAEHLLKDFSKAERYFNDEFENVVAANIPLYEEISDEIVRINLAAWKYRNLPSKWLFNIFCASSKMNVRKSGEINKYFDVCRAKTNGEQWDEFVAEYKKQGIHPVHHSEIYRKNEKPAYRVACKRFIRIFSVLEEITKSDSKPCVIAIEGRAASGKTTLAKDLAVAIEADIIHMDDFFLPPELRTTERLNEAGGNIDYDRFLAEVIPNISSEKKFSYRIFSCSKMGFDGRRGINNKTYRIVEGVYSLNPKFGDYADICVFSDVDALTQKERIINRNGEKLAEIFSSTWIPMEEKYFSTFNIAEKCNLRI